MACSCQVLALSTRGRIMRHGHQLSDQVYNFSLQFNNITQWLPYDDLLHLEWTVRNLSPAQYFQQYPHEERIHLKTSSPHLFFSFLPEELSELGELLSRAIARLHWQDMLDKSIN